MRSANLVLSFVLEVAGLAALAYWGWQAGADTLGKVGLAVGAPAVMVVVWGAFLAPRAAVRVPPMPKAIVSLLVLELTAAALIAAGQPVPGAVFAALILADAALAAWWRQQPSPHRLE